MCLPYIYNFLLVSILESINEKSLSDTSITSTVLIFEVLPALSISGISYLSPCLISKVFNCNVTLSSDILISVVLNSDVILSITPNE